MFYKLKINREEITDDERVMVSTANKLVSLSYIIHPEEFSVAKTYLLQRFMSL
jgi:hypothetical protein